MAKNLKGGYKIVSLNGLDLVGESLAIAGLYDKLAKSYDKPILVTGIVIDGEKKKNAFVQVEVLDDGIKINDLYGYDLLVEEDGDITVSANPQELPDVAEATAGQILKLNAQKKPEWGNEKQELPSTQAPASEGDVLAIGSGGNPVWKTLVLGTKLYRYTLTDSQNYIAFHLIDISRTSLDAMLPFAGYIDTFGPNSNTYIFYGARYQTGNLTIYYATTSAPSTVLTKSVSNFHELVKSEL